MHVIYKLKIPELEQYLDIFEVCCFWAHDYFGSTPPGNVQRCMSSETETIRLDKNWIIFYPIANAKCLVHIPIANAKCLVHIYTFMI